MLHGAGRTLIRGWPGLLVIALCLSSARVKRNPYARRIAEEGLVVQVGRGRPRRVLEAGGTTPRSVRFPEQIWTMLERRAKAKGLTLHAALREAILDWARRLAS